MSAQKDLNATTAPVRPFAPQEERTSRTASRVTVMHPGTDRITVKVSSRLRMAVTYVLTYARRRGLRLSLVPVAEAGNFENVTQSTIFYREVSTFYA